MIFGYIDYVITGDSFTKFFRRIMSDKLPVSKMCEKTESSLCVCLQNTVRRLKDYAMNLGLNTPPQNVTEALFLQNVFRKRRTCHRHCGCHAFVLLSIKRGGEV